MITDYISQKPINQVELISDGAFLNKDITEIKSLTNPNETIGYQSIRIYVPEAPGTEDEIRENFDLVWKAYEDGKYTGNILEDSIETVMNFWHSKNTENLENYLATHPILYTDGLYYGVEEKDQNEMTREYASYKMEEGAGLNPVGIQWHSKKGECKYMSEEEFIALASTVKTYAMTYYHLMQSRKKQIYDCTEKIDVFSIPITYDNINMNEDSDSKVETGIE